jgi:hypothetical protein
MSKCVLCGATFQGWGSYCRKCEDELSEIKERAKDRENERQRQKEEEEERETENKKDELAERMTELESFAKKRQLQVVYLYLPSDIMKLGRDMQIETSGSESQTAELTKVVIPLFFEITASFDILQKDERFINISYDYGLQLERKYAIADLRSALQSSKIEGPLHTYLLVRSRNNDLSIVLREAAQKAAEASTYEEKQVVLEDSPINAILYIKKTDEEKRMLMKLIIAVDQWYGNASEFSSALKDGTTTIESDFARTRVRNLVLNWCLSAAIALVMIFFIQISGWGKFGVVILILLSAIVVHAVVNSASNNIMEDKLKSLRSNLISQFLIRTDTSSQFEQLLGGEPSL